MILKKWISIGLTELFADWLWQADKLKLHEVIAVQTLSFRKGNNTVRIKFVKR